MPTPLVQPAPQFNFIATLWDAPERVAFVPIASAIASAAVDVASQLLFGAFSEVQGLDADIEIETYQEGGRNTSPHHFFKNAKYNNLVLKRGVTFNTAIWDWYHQVTTFAKRPRKNGMVVLLDRGGPNVVGAGLPGLARGGTSIAPSAGSPGTGPGSPGSSLPDSSTDGSNCFARSRKFRLW